MLRALWLFPVAVALLAIGLYPKSPAPAQSGKQLAHAVNGPAAHLPITRVVLFTSGVAYFQREGEVSGDARVDLTFPVRDVNDLLKSLILEDSNGGRIRAAACDSEGPIDKALKGFAVDLSGNPSFGQVLDQTRGEEVEVQMQAAAQPARIAGAVMGVERKKRPAGKDATAEVEMLNLWCADGMHSVKVADVQRVRFLNPVVENEVKQALKVLAAGHDRQKKTVSLNFTGKGKRQVRVGYVLESPIWKTNYRLEMGKDGKPVLQGWAFVQNPTDEDWNGVSMRLVSGQPISFRMNTYQPLYVNRPLVELESFGNLRPPVHEGTLDGKSREMRGSLPAGTAPDGVRIKGGMGETAIAGRLGDFFQYVVKDAVALPRHKSALIPILGQAVEGKKISIFSEKTHPKFPLLGLRIKNTSALHLMQGPITVYEAGSYAGDARLFNLQPNEERLISYAVDLGVEVEAAAKEGQSGPERIDSIKIDKGVVHAAHVVRETRVYTVKNRAEEDRQVIVEHPVRDRVKLIRPEERERTRDAYRFALAVPRGKTERVEVVEERDRREQVALTNADDGRIRIFLASTALSASAKMALQKASELKGKAESARREVARTEKELKDLTADQMRIRANMARVPETSDAYKRYLKKLEDQEKEIEQLQAQLKKLREAQEQHQQAYEAYLSNLTVK